MRIRDIFEGKDGGYTYQLPDALPMAQEWLDRFIKSGNPHDYFVFADWVHRFRDDPHLAGIEMPWQGFQKNRDVLKMMRGTLAMMMQDYQAQQWRLLQQRYGRLLSMTFQAGHAVHNGWNPRAKLGKSIMVQMLDNDVLGLRWAGDPKWVEIRGSNYWKWSPDDPLHQLIDRITGNISDLMIGREIAISPNYDEYEELKRLLTGE